MWVVLSDAAGKDRHRVEPLVESSAGGPVVQATRPAGRFVMYIKNGCGSSSRGYGIFNLLAFSEPSVQFILALALWSETKHSYAPPLTISSNHCQYVSSPVDSSPFTMAGIGTLLECRDQATRHHCAPRSVAASYPQDAPNTPDFPNRNSSTRCSRQTTSSPVYTLLGASVWGTTHALSED